MNKAELVEEVVNQTGLTRRESGDPGGTMLEPVSRILRMRFPYQSMVYWPDPKRRIILVATS